MGVDRERKVKSKKVSEASMIRLFKYVVAAFYNQVHHHYYFG